MKKLMALPLAAAAVLAVALVIFVNGSRGSYLSVLGENWRLSLPRNCEEVYVREDTGWFGDGDRYHVLVYADPIAITQGVGWQSGENPELKRELLDIIGPGVTDGTGIPGLNVPEEWQPSLEQCRWFTLRSKDDPRNTLILLRDGATLYIAEQFF